MAQRNRGRSLELGLNQLQGYIEIAAGAEGAPRPAQHFEKFSMGFVTGRQEAKRLLQTAAGDAQIVDDFRSVAHQSSGIERDEALEPFACRLHQVALCGAVRLS